MREMKVLCALIFSIVTVQSANILTIIPFPSYSHQQPLLSVSKELAIKGHKLTVITTNPPKEFIPNYEVIDISAGYQRLVQFEKDFGFTLQKEWNAFIFITLMADLFAAVCDYEMSLPQVQEFISKANNSKYDLVIIEDLLYSSYGGLVHKIGSPPVIGIHTFPPWSITDWPVGIPNNPAYMPDMFVGYTDKMDFIQRTYNTIFYWWTKYQMEYRILPYQERILRKYFGPDPPPSRDFEYNKSLVLMPTDLTATYPIPLPPNVIQIGPLHVAKPNPLPKDLQEWFDSSEDGVVYFSLGSNMKGTSLKTEKREAFVKAFAKFPKTRFLWKWESDEIIPGLSDNVLTRKWLPQQDILGHPKLSLFITQGGLQSTEEVTYHGKPVLGIPLFGDQRHNTWKLAKEGAGISLELHEVSFDSVYDALKKLLLDKSYKDNAKRLSKITKDQLVPAMDTAIWWVEYVIRHNGARHLRMSSFDLNWFQYNLLDVYVFLSVILLTVLYVLYNIIRIFISKFSVSSSKIKTN